MMTHLIAPALVVCLVSTSAGPERIKPFEIKVVDQESGRGVPLVELETTNNVRFLTDSNGVVAFDEPGLMDQRVFFHVRGHGYEFPKDGFGFRGQAIAITPGGSARLEIQRINIAERLYRVTGEGIYRDSVLVGRTPPIKAPLLNGLVLGSDSVVNVVHQGKIHWFWGDTNQVAYPLGNFQVPGATSRLPSQGGLDPEMGVDLQYFVNEKGFAKEMARMPGDGPTWIFGLVSFRDRQRRERMFANYVKVRNLLEVYEHGLVEYDDSAQQFKKVCAFPLDSPIRPGGQTFVRAEEGKTYVFYATPYPLIRVVADVEAISDISRYESYTCLKQATRIDQAAIDRDEAGRLRYGWKRNTSAVGPAEQAKLTKNGAIKAEEALLTLRNVETGKPVSAHTGSVYWNAYKNRWVMITVELAGTSMLGEVWYAEADTPLGPWVYARKVVTHDRYSFYNPKQHPMFDKNDGRTIFFEGTYTHSFSGNNVQTPRYDYNQVMYKLDLADPRLNLPVAHYLASNERKTQIFRRASRAVRTDEIGPVTFFALEHAGKQTVPVVESIDPDGELELEIGAPPATGRPARDTSVFHALPSTAKESPDLVVPLYRFTSKNGRRHVYSVDPPESLPGFARAEKPLCLVWRNPLKVQLPRN